MSPTESLAILADIAADVLRLLEQAELSRPVQSCPGWTVADLVGHLGEAHRWAEHAVRAGNPDAPRVSPPLTDRAALAAWYRESAAGLLTTLRAVGPDAECWSFGPRPRTTRFWFRRQPHEAAVHRWDLALALGRDAGYPEALAIDGVDEVVTMFFPRQVRLRRIPPLRASLTVQVDETDQSWSLHGDGTTERLEPAAAAVRGPAAALVLLLWGRLPLEDARIRLSGDRDAAIAVLSAGIVP